MEDKKKVSLMKDPRLSKLKKLAIIDLMPASQLTDFQNKLADLKTCYQLTEQELQTSPYCPHCNFKPNLEIFKVSASNTLVNLDDELDDLINSWTQTLLSNLEDPTTQENLDLLKKEDRELVDDFLKNRELPDDLSNEFIQALKEVLTGLEKLEITSDDLKNALLSGGSPATLEEIKSRFDNYLDEISKGKEPTKVRIVLD